MKKAAVIVLLLLMLPALFGCEAEKGEAAGEIIFYTEPTREFTEPSGTRRVELTKSQAGRIKRAICGVDRWLDDRMVNRFQYNFNGEIRFFDSDTVFYFQYEYGVIYYDHYIGGISEADMAYIKGLGSIFALWFHG